MIKRTKEFLVKRVYANRRGADEFVGKVILILATVIIGAAFLALAKGGLETIFEDVLGRITSSFK